MSAQRFSNSRLTPRLGLDTTLSIERAWQLLQSELRFPSDGRRKQREGA